MVTDDVDPTEVPLVVVDGRGKHRVGDVIDITPGQEEDLTELTVAAAVAVGTQVAKLAAVPLRLTGAALSRLAEGTWGQALAQGLRTVLEEPAAEGREEIAEAGRKVEEQFARLMGVVVPVVVEAVDVDLIVDQLDVDELLSHVDVNALLARVDVNGVLERVDVEALVDRLRMDALLERVDVDALVARVDANALLDKVDVNALLDRVDVDALLERVDVDALVARVDANALLDKVDVNALMDRVDVDALMERARIEEIVARSTSQVADSALDLGRRQAVGLDAVVMRIVDRVLGRDPSHMPEGPDILTEGDEG